MDLLLIILIGATGIWFGYKLAIRKKIKEVDYIPDKIETKKENRNDFSKGALISRAFKIILKEW